MRTNYRKILLDISELNKLFEKSLNLDQLLENIVSLVLRHFKTEDCVIYLDNPTQKNLKRKTIPKKEFESFFVESFGNKDSEFSTVFSNSQVSVLEKGVLMRL